MIHEILYTWLRYKSRRIFKPKLVTRTKEYEEEHDIRDVVWVNPSDPRVIYEDEPSSFQSEYDEDEEEEWEEEYEYDENEDYDEEGYPYDVNCVGEPGIEDTAREEFKNSFNLFSELTD